MTQLSATFNPLIRSKVSSSTIVLRYIGYTINGFWSWKNLIGIPFLNRMKPVFTKSSIFFSWDICKILKFCEILGVVPLWWRIKSHLWLRMLRYFLWIILSRAQFTKGKFLSSSQVYLNTNPTDRESKRQEIKGTVGTLDRFRWASLGLNSTSHSDPWTKYTISCYEFFVYVDSQYFNRKVFNKNFIL